MWGNPLEGGTHEVHSCRPPSVGSCTGMALRNPGLTRLGYSISPSLREGWCADIPLIPGRTPQASLAPSLREGLNAECGPQEGVCFNLYN